MAASKSNYGRGNITHSPKISAGCCFSCPVELPVAWQLDILVRTRGPRLCRRQRSPGAAPALRGPCWRKREAHSVMRGRRRHRAGTSSGLQRLGMPILGPLWSSRLFKMGKDLAPASRDLEQAPLL